MKFLATTCLVSELVKPRQKPHVLRFISENVFVVSPETLIDIQRGIVRLSRSNPQKAAELREWLAGVSSNWSLVAGREHEKARLVAAILECRDLKRIWLPHAKAAHPGFGYHVSIAATAIAHELPIAGFGIDAYLEIDRYFNLPGVLDLKDESWRFYESRAEAADWKRLPTHLEGADGGDKSQGKRAA